MSASIATEPDDARARPPTGRTAPISGVGGTAASRFSVNDDPEGEREPSGSIGPG